MMIISKIREKIMKAPKVWRPSTASLNHERLFKVAPLPVEEALRESEDKFAKAFRSIPDAIAITTIKDGRFIEVNDSYTRLTGYTREEVIGRSSTELNIWVKMEDRARMVQMLKKKGRVSNEEFNIHLKSGEIHVWLFSAEPINIGGEPCLISIATDITERKRAEEKLEHLNRVLSAIRNVNQLITKEKDRDRLPKGACNKLIETLGYYSVWIGLLDKSERLVPVAESGLDENFHELVKQYENGILNNCAIRALRQFEVIAIEDVQTDCRDCPLAKLYRDRGALSIRLQYGAKVYGVLTASIPSAYIQDGEEQSLIKELAGDIGFALHNIELEEERKKAEEALRQSEEFTDSVLKNAPNPIVVINPDTSIKYVNPAFEKLTGFTLAEIAGVKTPHPWWPEEQKKELSVSIKESIESGGRKVERLFQKKNGECFWVEMNLVSIIYNGTLKYHMANWVDITGRKRAVEALRESEEKFSKAFRSSPDAIAITTIKDGRFIEVNDCFARFTGYTREEVIDHSSIELGLWANIEDRARILQILQDQGRVNNEEFIIRIKSGELRTWLFSAEPINIRNKPCLISVTTDITGLKKTQEALRESEGKYRDLFDNTNDLIQSVTPDGSFRYVNNGWKQALGYSESEISNLKVFDIIHRDCLQEYETLFQKMKSGEDVGPINTTFVRKNGSKIIVEGNVTSKFENGEMVYTRAIYRDITKNKYLEEQMFRLSSILAMSTDYIVITDFDARIIDVNKKTLEIYGAQSKEELIGKHFLELIAPAQRSNVNMDIKEIMEKGCLEGREYSLITKQGREFPVQISTSLLKDADGKPMGMVRVGRALSSSIGLM
jgi:PAS domain S-box-containing protein